MEVVPHGQCRVAKFEYVIVLHNITITVMQCCSSSLADAAYTTMSQKPHQQLLLYSRKPHDACTWGPLQLRVMLHVQVAYIRHKLASFHEVLDLGVPLQHLTHRHSPGQPT